MPANTPRGYTYPLYTDAIDFPAQMQDLATDVDTDMQALLNLIAVAKNRPSARMTATANQAIVQNTDTTVTFATEAYDNFNMIDIPTNNTRIQLQQAGIYMLTGRVSFTAPMAAGAYVTMLRMNSDGGVIANPGIMSISGDDDRPTEMTIEQLHIVTTTIPDNITLTVRHSYTAPLNIAARSLCATKVSALLTGT